MDFFSSFYGANIEFFGVQNLMKVTCVNGIKLTASAVSLIGIANLFGASSAQALTNGSFETGDFTDWETIGNTSIETSAFGSGPTDGNFEAFLSTDDPTVSDSTLENFLDLAPGSLDSLGNGDATVGSAIRQTFTAEAGDILTFDWNFLTDEFTPDPFFNDFAFVSLTGLDTLANTFSPFVDSLTPLFDEETGFETFSFTIETAGTYTLGLGVTDVLDTIFDSGLLIDNVDLESVPEPVSVLSLIGLVALGAGSKLKRKQST